jgi:shikimate kinase
MKTNIALIGFMGAGKTTIAKALAKRINREFVELDSLIEREAGKSITDIFSQYGEIAFRELEIKVTKDISSYKNTVIACGGGIVLNQINIDRLKKESIIVYLAASPQILFGRLTDTKDGRPLLNVDDIKSIIFELLKYRKLLYEKAADIMIDTTKMTVDSVVGDIVNTLSCNENFNL